MVCWVLQQCSLPLPCTAVVVVLTIVPVRGPGEARTQCPLPRLDAVRGDQPLRAIR